MRFPKELVSQMTLDSLRRVGGGGWKRREEMASPMVWFSESDGCVAWCACRTAVVAYFDRKALAVNVYFTVSTDQFIISRKLQPLSTLFCEGAIS